ncbi:cucumber peeling cupredoxin [Rosa sericea]
MGPKKLSATTSVIAIVIALAAVLQTAEAETHKVSWNDTVGANYYTSWAANQTFKVGDLLVFNFTTGRHDVAEVAKDAYEKCNVTDLISNPKYDGPANYTLNATGDHYFICLFPGHCDQGQKLAINVTTSHSGSAPTPAPAPSSTGTPPPPGAKSPPSSTSPPPSTSSTTAPPPPPKGSTGSSSHVVTISTVFMSIAVALFCLF